MKTDGFRTPWSARLFRAGLVAAPMALAACGESYEAERLRATEDRNEIATVSVPAWPGNEAVAVGEWRPTMADGAAAMDFYGPPGTGPVFRMACDERRGMMLERRGVEAVAGIGMMEIAVNGEVARLALNQPNTQLPVLRAAVPHNHELMTALAAPRGQFAVRAGDGPRLVLPLGPGTAALAATCRTPDIETAS